MTHPYPISAGMRLLTLAALVLMAWAFPAMATETTAATTADQTWYSTGCKYWLQAWDGKSDPSQNPRFEEVGQNKFVLKNQKCHKGMEFTIRCNDNGGDFWCNPSLPTVTPGDLKECLRRENWDPVINWVIQEDGVYDFILQRLPDNYYGFRNYLIVQKQGQQNQWSVPLTVNEDNESADAPKTFLLSEPVLGVYHYMEPRSSAAVNLTGPDGKVYGFRKTDSNTSSGNNYIKVNTVVDMAELDAADTSVIPLASSTKKSLYLFDTNSNKALMYLLWDTWYNPGTRLTVIGRDADSTDDTWPYELKMATDDAKFPSRLSAVVKNRVDGEVTHQVPENFEFYIKAESVYGNTVTPLTGLDLRPATGNDAGETIDKEVPANILPEVFGGKGTWKIKTGGLPFVIGFDAESMTVRGFKPEGNPWGIGADPVEDLYDALYLVGDLKLIDGNGDKVRINKWTTCDDRLKLIKTQMGPKKMTTIDLNVYDDSYFRITTPENAIDANWAFSSNDKPIYFKTRGNWSPQSSHDVDVPMSITWDNAASTWFQGKPGEGPRFHLPKGKYSLYVFHQPTDEPTVGPNCLKVYAFPKVDTETYYLSVQDQQTAQTATYRLTGDGDRLSCKFQTELPSYANSDRVTSYIFIYKINPEGKISYIHGAENYAANLDSEIPLSMTESKGEPSPKFTFTKEPGNYEFKLDLSDINAIKGMITEPDDANMPLKPEDFTDAAGNAKARYFLVGSRTADFRLLPEWELKAENGYSIENRLMYPGMFGIARVDNYDDYIHHRFELFVTLDQPGAGKIINEAGSHKLDRDPSTPWDSSTNSKMKATAITEYGHYNIAANSHGWSEWPYYVLSTKPQGYDNTPFAAGWWHFCEFPVPTEGEAEAIIGNLSEAFKKGTPSLATFHIELSNEDNDAGAPAQFVIDKVTTWNKDGKTDIQAKADKQAILDQVNFMLCGSEIVNESRNADGTLVIDPARNPLNGYTNVTEWANQWIQYDQATGRPYIDAYGKYLPMSVYQDSWMKDHPVLFYREADDHHYTSNDLILKPLKAIEALEQPDKFLQYYKDMQDKTLGDGTNKKHAEGATFKYDFYDRVGEPDADTYMKFRKGNIEAPADGWQPYVLSDLSLGGIFKVWSGFGGGHAGFGAWRDDIVPGDGYAWFNLNVGHYMARNPMRVDTRDLEQNASNSTETPYPDDKLVDFYITGKDAPAADFMTIPDENGVFASKDIKRLILWLNTEDRTDMSDNRTSGMARSYVQLVASDLSPVIRAYFGEAPRSVCYAWHLVNDNVIEDKEIEKAVVSVYRNNVLLETIEQTDAAGKMASACTAEDKFKGELKDQLPGEYWFRVDVTYADGAEKDAVSTRLNLYPTMIPVELSASQTKGSFIGNGNEEVTTYGFSIDCMVGISAENANKEFVAYTDNEGNEQWLRIKDIISGFEVTVNGKALPDDDTDASNGNRAYTHGQNISFRYPLTGEKNFSISAKPVIRTKIPVDNAPTATVQLSEDLLKHLTISASSASVNETVPAPKSYYSPMVTNKKEIIEDYINFPGSADTHPGHHEIAPVYYHAVNYLSCTCICDNNVLLEGEGDMAETVTYIMSGPTGESKDANFSSSDETAAINKFEVVLDYVGTQTASYANLIKANMSGFEIVAVYSRGGREIYRASSPVGYYTSSNYIQIYGPYTTKLDTSRLNPYVSDIFDDDAGNQHKVYDLRVSMDKLVANMDHANYKPYNIYGGFELTDKSNYSGCAHTSENPDYGKHVQPAPYVPATSSWAGQSWPGLPNYTEWFAENGQWSKEKNDWSTRITTENFGINIPHVSCTTGEEKLTKIPAINLRVWLVYPFLVKKPVAQAASASAAKARAAAMPAYESTIAIHKLSANVNGVELPIQNEVVTGIGVVEADGEACRHDVCTPAGVVVLRDVTLEEAEKTLSPGVYLFGSEKIVIR